MDFDKIFPGHFKRGDAIYAEEDRLAVTLAYLEDGEWVVTDAGKARAKAPLADKKASAVQSGGKKNPAKPKPESPAPEVPETPEPPAADDGADADLSI